MAVGNFTYNRTTNATVQNQSGVVQTLTPNNAPFFFDDNAVPLGLIIEEARTNIILRSQELTAPWNAGGFGVALAPVLTPNDGLAPDGTMTATRVDFDCVDAGSAANRSLLSQAVTIANGTPHAGTLYIKAATPADVGKTLRIFGDDVLTSAVYTLTANYVRYMSPIVNSTSTAGNFGIEARGGFTTQSASAYIWGVQLEAGLNPTSYIKTEGSTVTRTVATCIKNAIPSQIGQSEGTIYTHVITNSYNASRVIASIYDDASNEIRIGKTNTGAFFASYRVGGTETVNVVNATANRSGSFKLATAYNATGMQLFINGANGGTNTAGAVAGFDNVALGHNASGTAQFNDAISAFALFTRRLSTNELTDLTT